MSGDFYKFTILQSWSWRWRGGAARNWNADMVFMTVKLWRTITVGGEAASLYTKDKTDSYPAVDDKL